MVSLRYSKSCAPRLALLLWRILSIAGFELYTDFILADFLISCTPFVSEVVFQ